MDAFDTPESELSIDVESAASTAAALGIATLACAFLGQCTCYMGYFIGLGTGAGAIYLAMQANAMNPTGEARAYATVGLYAGAMGLAFNLMMCAIVVMIVVLYGGIFLMIAAGANF